MRLPKDLLLLLGVSCLLLTTACDSQKVQPPPDDTEEFLNGWNFE